MKLEKGKIFTKEQENNPNRYLKIEGDKLIPNVSVHDATCFTVCWFHHKNNEALILMTSCKSRVVAVENEKVVVIKNPFPDSNPQNIHDEDDELHEAAKKCAFFKLGLGKGFKMDLICEDSGDIYMGYEDDDEGEIAVVKDVTDAAIVCMEPNTYLK